MYYVLYGIIYYTVFIMYYVVLNPGGAGGTQWTRPTRPTAPARLHEWEGVLMGARASRNRAGAAVGGDGDKKRQRF